MRKFVISGGIIAGLFVYFMMTVVILPDEYLSHEIVEPQPIQSTTLSANEISLGESLEIQIEIENKNDVADILITSVAFPEIQEIGDVVKIVSYDYTQSPRYIERGDKINSVYTKGGQITAQHPSIEAYSRNVPANTIYQMSVLITPQNTGIFEIHIKTIAIPHTSDLAHYPYDGVLDYQDEFVTVHTVTVNP